MWWNGSAIDRPEGLNRPVRRNYFFQGSSCAFRLQIYLDNGGHRPGTSTGQKWRLITLHYITQRRSSQFVSPRVSLFPSMAAASGTPATPAPSCNNFIYLLNPATYVSRMINGCARILTPSHSLSNIPSNEEERITYLPSAFSQSIGEKKRVKRRDIPGL